MSLRPVARAIVLFLMPASAAFSMFEAVRPPIIFAGAEGSLVMGRPDSLIRFAGSEVSREMGRANPLVEGVEVLEAT